MRLLPAPAPRHRALVLAICVTFFVGLLGTPLSASYAAPVATALASPKVTPTVPDVAHLPPDCFAPGNNQPSAGACYLTPYRKTRPSILIWGDSHAWMYIPALEKAVQHEPVNLVSFVAGSCPPTLIPVTPNDVYATKCEHNNVLAMRWITTRMEHHRDIKLILGSNWEGFRQGYRKMALDGIAPVSGYNDFTKHMIELSHEYTAPLFKRLAQLKVPTDVMRQAATVPDFEDSMTGCTVGTPPYNPYVCDLLRKRAIPQEHLTDHWLAGLMKPLVSARYIDTTGVYCDALVCHGRIGHINTFYDHLHLSATRTRTMWRFFIPSIRDTLKK